MYCITVSIKNVNAIGLPLMRTLFKSVIIEMIYCGFITMVFANNMEIINFLDFIKVSPPPTFQIDVLANVFLAKI